MISLEIRRMILEAVEDAGGYIEKEKLVKQLEALGVKREEIEKQLKWLLLVGILYEPAPGVVAIP